MLSCWRVGNVVMLRVGNVVMLRVGNVVSSGSSHNGANMSS